MSELQELLHQILRTLARTGSALQRLRATLAPRFPVTAERLKAFDDATSIATDAMLKRFEQHVDAIRAAARTIIRIEGEQDRYRTLRHALDRLATFGVVENADRVIQLVDLRNRTVHAYAPESERQAQILNAVFEAVPELLDLAARLARFVRAEKLLPAEAESVLAEAEALAAPG